MSDKKIQSMIHANGLEISVVTTVGSDEDYISLSDIAKYRDPEHPGYIIQNWMRNRSTVEYLGLWESLHNTSFYYLEFEAIKADSGNNGFVMTPKRWIAQTTAIGMVSKQGRYADTSAPHIKQ